MLHRSALRRAGELVEGLDGAGGMHERRPATHVDSHAERFVDLLTSGSQLGQRLSSDRTSKSQCIDRPESHLTIGAVVGWWGLALRLFAGPRGRIDLSFAECLESESVSLKRADD